MDDALLRALCSQAPFANGADAELALVSTLELLGFSLPEHLLRQLKAALPASCAGPLSAGQELSRSRNWAAIDEASLPAPGQPLERVEEVCSALARLLPAELVADLQRELPARLAGAFTDAGAHSLPAAGHTSRRAGARHLSEAALGSAHSLASGQPRGPQQDSVAAANPHGDTKLSSARGLTQEREKEDLAEGSAPTTRRKGSP